MRASTWVHVGAACLLACGGRDCPPIDEAALATRVRAQVLEELAQERARQAQEEPIADDGHERFRVEGAHAPARGAHDPLVLIVMFSDFQCPFCARVEPTLDRLLSDFPNDLRIVFRNNPLVFHQNADLAAEAALEAYDQGGNDLFWRLHDVMFAHQQALTRPELEAYAAQVGVDPIALAQALDARTHHARIVEDQETATRLGARGTPAFFVNGRVLMGAQPYDAFAQMVREEIAIAQRELARGISRSELYARRMRGALDAAVPPAPSPAPAPAAPPPADRIYTLAVPPLAPARGPANAPVTIQVFSDFQCPFCNRVRPTIDHLLAAYGPRVRLVWRDYPLPFHPSAMPAAEAAREVLRQRGESAFWRYHGLVYDHQQQLDVDTLVRLAGQVPGVDARAVRRALDAHTHQADVQRDIDAVRAAGAEIGTPSFFINGRLLQGAQPEEAFRAAVERALSELPP